MANIAAGLAQTNPARAERVVRTLRQKCEGLADMPRRFQLVPRFEHTNVRRRVAEDFLIFYRLTDDTVQILRVLHGATDYATQFLQKP